MLRIEKFVFFLIVCHCWIIVTNHPMRQGFLRRIFQHDFIQDFRNNLRFPNTSKSHINSSKPNVESHDEISKTEVARKNYYSESIPIVTMYPQYHNIERNRAEGNGKIDFSRSDDEQEKLKKNVFSDSNYDKIVFKYDDEDVIGATSHYNIKSDSKQIETDTSDCSPLINLSCDEQKKAFAEIFKKNKFDNDIDTETTTESYDMTTEDLFRIHAPAQVVAALLG